MSEMSRDNEPHPSGRKSLIVAWLESVGGLRDGLLVVGGVLYFLGYITWSLNAWRNGLGLLPAIESQYFIAGIVPALVIGLAFLLVKLGVRLIFKLQQWLLPHVKKHPIALTVAFLVMLVTTCIYFIKAMSEIHTLAETNSTTYLYAALSGILLYLLVIVFPNASRSARVIRLSKVMDIVLFTFTIVVTGVLTIIFYVTVIYPNLPQALGGVLPRLVCLDIAKEDLSKETRAIFVPKAVDGTTPEVEGESIIHTKKVELMFSGADYILIKVDHTIYEVKKEAVHSMKPCD